MKLNSFNIKATTFLSIALCNKSSQSFSSICYTKSLAKGSAI